MRCLFVAVALSFCSASLLAQRGGGTVPSVGTALPDVTVFDEHGNDFPFRQLRGEYSVVVFGCLT